MNEETLPPAAEQDPLVKNETPTVGTEQLGEQRPAEPQRTPETTGYRQLIEHVVNPANDKLVIEVLDEPGQGGACHHYRISGFNTEGNPSDPFMARHGRPAEHATILFQNGPIAEFGVNGLTHEALLAILCDRLAMFQAGKYACPENAMALDSLRRAQFFLRSRTQKRMARGVEGTHEQ